MPRHLPYYSKLFDQSSDFRQLYLLRLIAFQEEGLPVDETLPVTICW